MTKRVLVVPPPIEGGGPSNAVLRMIAALTPFNVFVTTRMLSAWHAALLNVGLGVRFDALRILRLGRRIVFRADGCYDRDVFDREGYAWNPEYDKANKRIKQALETVDFVIYQSLFCKRHLDKLSKRPDGTFAICHNGVDLDVFTPSGCFPNDIPVVGAIGKFRRNRIRTLGDIARQIPIAHRLLLVGRLDEQCARDLADLEACDKHYVVEYHPHVIGDQALANYHRRIDCYLHPFLSDWCPNSVVESLACGTPTVVCEGTGGSELVADAGLVVKAHRQDDYSIFTESFAAAAMEALNNRDFYSVRARRHAEESLDVNQMAVSYLKSLLNDDFVLQ
ncbi:MAG: glycosyltransferase [Anaerolineae bacterium]|nr:glycosyltransferase [Anaerolineae bacterium]